VKVLYLVTALSDMVYAMMKILSIAFVPYSSVTSKIRVKKLLDKRPANVLTSGIVEAHSLTIYEVEDKVAIHSIVFASESSNANKKAIFTPPLNFMIRIHLFLKLVVNKAISLYKENSATK